MTHLTDDEITTFELWWQEHGQYSRAGGGDYEKTFAYNAWNARALLAEQARTQTHKAEDAPGDAELLDWLEEAYTRGGYDQGRDWREFMSNVAQQGFRATIRAAIAQERKAP